MAINIELAAAQSHYRVIAFKEDNEEGVGENLIQTGKLDRFFTKIQLTDESEEEDKLRIITLLFDNLSQVMGSQGPFKGECEALLKEHIYTICESGVSEDAIAIINQPKYRLNSQLTEVMNKSDYLLKKPYPSKYSSFWNTRFAHHLKKNLGNMAVMTKGAAYMTFGLGAFAVGINKCLPDNGKDSNLPIGLTYMAMGVSLIAAPIISAIQSAKTNVP